MENRAVESRKKENDALDFKTNEVFIEKNNLVAGCQKDHSFGVKERLESISLILQEARENYASLEHKERGAFGKIMKVLGLKNRERPDNAKNSFQYRNYKKIWHDFLDLHIQMCKDGYVNAEKSFLKKEASTKGNVKKEIGGLVVYLQTKENLILMNLRLDEIIAEMGDTIVGLQGKLSLKTGIALPELFQGKKKKDDSIESKLVHQSASEVENTSGVEEAMVAEEKEDGLWHMIERLGGSELVGLISEAKKLSGEDFNVAYRKIFHNIINSIHKEHKGDLKDLGNLDAKKYILPGQIDNSKIGILAEFSGKHLGSDFVEARSGESVKDWVARTVGVMILRLCEDQCESLGDQVEA